MPNLQASGNRPQAVETQDNYTTLIDYDGGTNPIYVGKAAPGTATSALTGWSIKKITWDGSDNPTAVKWASGTVGFDKEWDERASYVYS